MSANVPIPIKRPVAPAAPAALTPKVAPGMAGPARGGEEGAQKRELPLAEKAAIIIAALGAEAAPHVLQGMSETTMRRFAEAMTRIGVVTPEMLDEVIEEFSSELGSRNQIRVGATEARKILGEMLDDDSVARIMDDVDLSSGRTVWEKLSNSSDQALAGYLRHEHPQTVAVILSKLRAEKAARVLERLDGDFAQIVVLRLARVPRLDSEVMEVVRDILQRDFLAVMQREQATRRPADIIGAMMNSVSMSHRSRLMEQLEQEKPKLAKQVQKVMFSFIDIADRVDPRDAGTLLKGVDEPTLLLALKHAETNAPRVIDFFMSNISKRLAQRLESEIKMRSAPILREGEAAQSAVVGVVRALVDTNEVRMTEGDEEDE